MKSKLINNSKPKAIEWNKSQLIKKINPEGMFIILSTNKKNANSIFEGIVVYSENPNYSIGDYSTIWGKKNAELCDTNEQINLSN